MFAFSPQPCTSLRLCGVLLALLSLATPFQATAQNIFIGSGEVLETTNDATFESISNIGELINTAAIKALDSTQNQGRIENAGTFENLGSFDNFLGTVENAGRFQNLGYFDNFFAGEVENTGTFENLGSFKNHFAGIIDNSGTFYNSGDIDNSFGTIENNGTFDNSGDISNSHGSIKNSGTLEQAGRIQGDQGRIENAGTFTLRGDIRGDQIEILNSGIFHLNGFIEGEQTSFTQTEGTVVIGGLFRGEDFSVTGGTARSEGGSLQGTDFNGSSFSFSDTTLSLGNGDRELSVATGRLGSLLIAGDSLVDIVLEPDAGGVALSADRVSIQSDVMFEISFIDGAVIEDGDVFDLIAADEFTGSFDVTDQSRFTFPDTFGFEWDVAVASGADQFGRDILRATASAVAPIPLPAGAWLLGAGLLGLAGLKRRRKPA
ncbi:VPLPA-CTERM sorting domain-containing protein [Dinoroseobacter sp. S76]|uniref:VPLPA-CTERM sorting domain-containing protein n=1 Tax=Dinoroseobacter sp. S76 TaxID=3415124 RepID=UPI003C7EAD3B